MTKQKWTIRGIDPEAKAILEDIHAEYGVPYGRLVSMALWSWIDELDEDDPVPITRPLLEAA
ncbi:MAG: hypothetical protein ABJE63_11915 [Lentilitoribacter sp.]